MLAAQFFMKNYTITILILLILICSCQSDLQQTLFEDITTSAGIDFNNDLTYTEAFNPYTYRSFFNGAGVALGDVNNDGLLDIYFTGNMVDSKLYLNKGNNQFEDISDSAGVACANVWSSGATFADVNGDGLLDLYVCKSGKPEGERRHNELFINNGDLTFTERAAEYNLNINGLSIHSAFFDYDKDGDLDVYILTNSGKSVGVGIDLVEGQREISDPTNGGNKFLRNDNGIFTDITTEVGIYSSAIGFGLGITLGDFNNDDWTDIYVSNDFFEKDYLYLNDQHGAFTEDGEDYFASMSMGSMGADMADLNNDGLQELLVTEMLPTSLDRQRTKTIFENWNKYNIGVSKGYHHQFSRNVLQRNTGNNNFLEIGRYAGVSATEWSWGALMFDMNNDGLRDIFVSNGIVKDLLDRDYLNFMANPEEVRSIIKTKGNVIEELLAKIPEGKVSNAAFVNKGNLKFEDEAVILGLGKPTFSSGSAYGDLDNDGDLDLVVNNINGPSQIFENRTDTLSQLSIRLKLIGRQQNTFAIGAKVYAYGHQQLFYAENYPSRGFQSSMDPIIHLGLGDIEMLDSLVIQWPTGELTKSMNVKTGRLYTYNQEEGLKNKTIKSTKTNSAWRSIELANGHKENLHNDFDREPLLDQMYNNLGPQMAVADIDQDGKLDVFIGGAKSESGKLFKGAKDEKESMRLALGSKEEDTASVFFDADGDGDEDLYICSGGRAFSKNSVQLNDRLYFNDGQGNFTSLKDALPALRNYSSSCVTVSDIDVDGDLDLFVGERFHPFYYGTDGGGHILINDGSGRFTEQSMKDNAGFEALGMVTDAAWMDVNGDDQDDLIVVGDWMDIQIFINKNGELKASTSEYLRGDISGRWNTIEIADVDSDGDMDFIAGNHGENSFFKPGLRMYMNDFDRNGSMDHIICYLIDGKYYPIADKDELTSQLPALRKKIFYYKDYANASMADLFDAVLIESAIKLDAAVLRTTLFMNNGNGFDISSLPVEVQYSSIYAIEAEDLNDDGHVDLIFGGNQFLVKPQFGRYDGLSGMIIYGSTMGFHSDQVEFLNVKGQIRDIEIIREENNKKIIFARNGENAVVYE